MRRAVIDANVWVSATAFPGGVPTDVIDLVRRDRVESVLSELIVQQVIRSLLRIGTAAGQIDEATHEMRELSAMVSPVVRLSVITAKDSDNRILECAVAGGADVIVTGDRKHLLPLGQYEGIRIVSPRDFIEALDPQ